MDVVVVEGKQLGPEDFAEGAGWCEVRKKKKANCPTESAENHQTQSQRETPATSTMGIDAAGATAAQLKRRCARQVQKLAMASRMPALPAEDYKIVVRPRGGFNVTDYGTDRIYCCLRNAAGIGKQAAEEDSICINIKQNVVVLSTPSEDRAIRYGAICKLRIGDREFEANAYRAAPENTSKGLIKNISKTETQADIVSNLVTLRNPGPGTEVEKQVQDARWRRSGRLSCRLRLSRKSAAATRSPRQWCTGELGGRRRLSWRRRRWGGTRWGPRRVGAGGSELELAIERALQQRLRPLETTIAELRRENALLREENSKLKGAAPRPQQPQLQERHATPSTPLSPTPSRPEPAGMDTDDESGSVETADERENRPPTGKRIALDPARPDNKKRCGRYEKLRQRVDNIEKNLDERFAKQMAQMDEMFNNAIAKLSEHMTQMFATQSTRINDIEARLPPAAGRPIRTINKPYARQQPNQQQQQNTQADVEAHSQQQSSHLDGDGLH
ncbi:hypothetical protein HPB50_028941 [Hyalomma asiaticum]|nr:hypothetical protein HPB50_028941 [Hyalomma asiaticum]